MRCRMVRVECPTMLQALIALCLYIDSCLESHHQVQSHCLITAPYLSVPVGPPLVPSGNSNESEPMHLGAVWPRLTPEEKAGCWDMNLCLYYGGVGHFSATCPTKHHLLLLPNDLPPSLSSPISLGQVMGACDFSVTDQNAFFLPVWLQLPDEHRLIVQAMIESGAGQCFMDTTFSKKHQISLQDKDTPTLAEALMGIFSAPAQ